MADDHRIQLLHLLHNLREGHPWIELDKPVLENVQKRHEISKRPVIEQLLRTKDEALPDPIGVLTVKAVHHQQRACTVLGDVEIWLKATQRELLRRVPLVLAVYIEVVVVHVFAQ